MKRKLSIKMLMLVLITLIVSSVLCACGSESYDYAVSEKTNGLVAEDSMSSSSADFESADTSAKDSRKIIETIYYSVQTKNFDNLVTMLEAKVIQVGGYIEKSDISGNAYDDISARYATFTFRVPSDKVDEFTNIVSENSTVINRTVNTEDVTLEYVDVESRIKALKTEKESLEELLESATSTAEIIEIRDLLTDVIYEIESYESQLRTFDNLIDYTTVTINVDEVEYVSVVSEQTVWQRIGTNLTENFRSLWNFLVELFVAVISGLPFILFIAIVVIILVLTIKLVTKKSKKRRVDNPKSVVNYQNPVPYITKHDTPINQEDKKE